MRQEKADPLKGCSGRLSTLILKYYLHNMHKRCIIMQANRMICQMKAENGLKRRGKFLETVFLMEILYFL